MSTLPEQFSAAGKSQIEAQMSFFHQFTVKAVERAEKMMHLNIDTARDSLANSKQAMSQLLLVKDPRDLLALANQSQQNFDSLMRYSRALLGIATEAPGQVPPQAAPAPAPQAPVAATPAPAAKVAVAPAPTPTVAVAPAPAPAAKIAPPPAPEVQPQPELFEPADNIVAAPQPVAEVAPVPVVAKPIAKAVKEIAPKPVLVKPAAAPVPAVAKSKVVVTGVKPVEASRPPAPVKGKPALEAKPTEPKARKKK